MRKEITPFAGSICDYIFLAIVISSMFTHAFFLDTGRPLHAICVLLFGILIKLSSIEAVLRYPERRKEHHEQQQ